VKILAFQAGPGGLSIQRNIQAMVLGVREASRVETPDLIVLPELATTPYFCGSGEKRFLEWAEPVPGPTTQAFAALARELRANLVVGMFEQGGGRGEFYNSAVVLNRNGEIVWGSLPDGAKVRAYRKTHVADILANEDGSPGSNEKYYFRPGPGLPTFALDCCRLGILICYDRSFPEAWRVLALHGAEVVAIPTASYRAGRSDTYLFEVQTACLQNAVFGVAVNKGGLEACLEGKRHFFGTSAIVNPMGEIVAQGPVREGPAVVRASVDLAEIHRHTWRYHFFRDRRPEIYTGILKTVVD
jgi:N-carbamoylputrescine amidase